MILKAHLLNSDLFSYIEKRKEKKNWDECNEKVFPVHTEQMRLNVQNASVLHVSSLSVLSLLLQWSHGLRCVHVALCCVHDFFKNDDKAWLSCTLVVYIYSIVTMLNSHTISSIMKWFKINQSRRHEHRAKKISIFSPLTHSMFSPTSSAEVNVMALHPK